MEGWNGLKKIGNGWKGLRWVRGLGWVREGWDGLEG